MTEEEPSVEQEHEDEDATSTVNRRLTLVIHEASAELLEGSPVAHGPERPVELVVGDHQVLGVPSHVDDLEFKGDTSAPQMFR